MKTNTSDLIGPALDWAAAKADGCEWMYENLRADPPPGAAYSTDWSQGGPIIDQMMREGLQLVRPVDVPAEQYACRATLGQSNSFYFGPTSLIAAMRCFVASKLGDEVEIPDELLEST